MGGSSKEFVWAEYRPGNGDERGDPVVPVPVVVIASRCINRPALDWMFRWA